MIVRLCLTVEGVSEQAFAHELLREHLAGCGVMLEKPRLTAFSRRRGVVRRGGLRSYLPVKNDLQRWFRQEKDAGVRFSTMIDLYGLRDDFPGRDAARKKSDPYDRVETLEAALAADLGDSRFIPYIQLHEFEALLLAKPAGFRSFFVDCEEQVRELERLVAGYTSPEEIDDGQPTAPSKRIAEFFPEYPDAKPAAARVIAQAVTLAAMREKCPHFGRWLTKLEQLGSGG